MRAFLLFTFVSLLLTIQPFAQQTKERNIILKHIGNNDSIHIPFTADYYLIEDSCAQIIRQARFSKEHKFYGNFTDVSSTDAKQIMATGAYTPEGLKTGLFTLYYPNGNVRATGNFEQDELTGTWKLFYENGNSKLTLTADKGQITIHDAWDSKGKQTITQGYGNYQTKVSLLTWSGKLLNGKPEGTWQAVSATAGTKETVLTEKYKNGQFLNGVGPLGTYKDDSRIIWLTPFELPFLNAEKMYLSLFPCGVAYKTGAYYRHGQNAFTEEIKRLVNDYLKGINIKPYDKNLVIEAEIAESGRITNFSYQNAFDEKIASGIIAALRKLPLLEPARADGNPIKQKFEIRFEFRSGIYYFNYRFMPL